MPEIIDPETMNVDELPAVWSPVQWDQTEEERIHEIENQASASLLATVDVPEAILRLLLYETEVENLHEPPDGYDTSSQGEWDPDLITFAFKRRVRLVEAHREPDLLMAEYDVQDLGHWVLEIGTEKVTIERK